LLLTAFHCCSQLFIAAHSFSLLLTAFHCCSQLFIAAHSCRCRRRCQRLLVQVVASVLQLQSAAAACRQEDSLPLAIVAAIHSPAVQSVLRHSVAAFAAERANAIGAAAAEAAAARRGGGRSSSAATTAAAAEAAAAAAVAALQPAVSLHLMRPDDLMAGLIAQVCVGGSSVCLPKLQCAYTYAYGVHLTRIPTAST
jgi:hypothetical protein